MQAPPLGGLLHFPDTRHTGHKPLMAWKLTSWVLCLLYLYSQIISRQQKYLLTFVLDFMLAVTRKPLLDLSVLPPCCHTPAQSVSCPCDPVTNECQEVATLPAILPITRLGGLLSMGGLQMRAGVMSHLCCNSFIKKPTCNKYTTPSIQTNQRV